MKAMIRMLAGISRGLSLSMKSRVFRWKAGLFQGEMYYSSFEPKIAILERRRKVLQRQYSAGRSLVRPRVGMRRRTFG